MISNLIKDFSKTDLNDYDSSVALDALSFEHHWGC
jgi:hypothetical protein